MPLPLPPVANHRTTRNTGECRGSVQNTSKGDDGKLTTLRDYRRARGLCFKCGEKWGHAQKCSTTVPLHLVEEMWELAMEGEEMVEETENALEEPQGESVLAIYVAAVSGGEGNKTIRL
jgi:hypothetical protein